MPRPFAVAVAATAAAWIPPIAFGLRWPDYHASRDFISELGAAGAPDALAVNASFLVAGLLFVAACWAIARYQGHGRSTAALVLVSLVGGSYVMAAFVPCDSGCPAEGSPAQTLHNTVGGLAYLAGAIGLLLAARPRTAPHGPVWLAATAGCLAIACLVGMGAPELAGIRGAVQRVAEAAIFTWLLVEGAAVERARGRSA